MRVRACVRERARVRGFVCACAPAIVCVNACMCVREFVCVRECVCVCVRE